jgi:hypothetical protein
VLGPASKEATLEINVHGTSAKAVFSRAQVLDFHARVDRMDVVAIVNAMVERLMRWGPSASGANLTPFRKGLPVSRLLNLDAVTVVSSAYAVSPSPSMAQRTTPPLHGVSAFELLAALLWFVLN